MLWFLCVFSCKQKTAYEMRISDWSSDVCSSDLIGRIDERSHGDLERRHADADHLLAVLPAPKRPGQRVKPRIFGIDVGVFLKRAARPRTARIGAVQPRVIDLDHPPDDARPTQPGRIFLTLLVELRDPDTDRKSTRLNSSH